MGIPLRLTLRTLLAYRDHVLASADHEDLHHRIHQSADATNLLKRIGVAIQGAAKSGGRLMGKSSSLNPNDVAEYLDDVLGGTRVSELERACLESDDRLAEIGHCHEILSTAFQTHVRLPSHVRAKAIALSAISEVARPTHTTTAIPEPPPFSNTGKRINSDSNHAKTSDSDSNVRIQVASPMIASGGDSIRPKGLNLEESRLATEVPEYLIGRQRLRWLGPTALLGLLILFAFLISQTLGPWSTIASLFTRSEVAVGSDPISDKFAPPSSTVPPAPNNSASLESRIEEPANSDRTSTVANADTGLEAGNGPAPSANGNSSQSNSEGESTVSSNNQTAAPETAPKEDLGAGKTTSSSKYQLTPEGNYPAIVMTGKGKTIAVGAQPVLLETGTLILTPPATTTNLNVDDSVAFLLSGLNSLTLRSKDSTSIPHIGLSIAHIVCTTEQECATILETEMGPFLVSFKAPNTSSTIEYSYRRTAWGSIADERNFAPYLVLIAAEGTIDCVPLDGQGKPIDAQRIEITPGQGAAFTTKQQSLRFPVKQIPPWVRPESVRSIDLLAAHQLSDILSQKQATDEVDKALIEATQNRRAEVAAIAIQCKAMQGDFNAFCFEMLANPKFRSHWRQTIDLVQQLAASDATNEQQLQKAIQVNFGQNQSVAEQLLFESLPTPPATPEEWNAVVDHLASDNLATRVLANNLLENWIGTPINYLPTSENRKDLILKIRRDVNSSKSWQTTPLRPLYERYPQS